MCDNSTFDYEDNGIENLSDSIAPVLDEILYPLTIFVGFFGNVTTCFVIIRNKSMHTAINYYLFNLAMSDSLIIVKCFALHYDLPEDTWLSCQLR